MKSLQKIFRDPFGPLTDKEKAEQLKYNDASIDDQLRFSNSANDQLFQITSLEIGMLPAISTVAAALLIVASFNPNLVPLTRTVRVLISLLLLLVPTSLSFHAYTLRRAKRNGLRLMYIYRGEKLGMQGLDKIAYSAHIGLLAILWIVVLGIVSVIL